MGRFPSGLLSLVFLGPLQPGQAQIDANSNPLLQFLRSSLPHPYSNYICRVSLQSLQSSRPALWLPTLALPQRLQPLRGRSPRERKHMEMDGSHVQFTFNGASWAGKMWPFCRSGRPISCPNLQRLQVGEKWPERIRGRCAAHRGGCSRLGI